MMLPFLLTTLKRCSGVEESKQWKVSVVILSTLPEQQHFLLGTIRPFPYLHPFLPQPCFCNVCTMWFCIVLLKIVLMLSWRLPSPIMLPSQKSDALSRTLMQHNTSTTPDFWTCNSTVWNYLSIIDLDHFVVFYLSIKKRRAGILIFLTA